MQNKLIHVTQPSLAPLSEFFEILQSAWSSGILTHNGPLVQRLEKELSSLLGLKDCILSSNGTTALQMAIKALRLKGEIITSPFTWIATVSAIKCEGCTPVFCDIDPETLNIDPQKIEEKITKKTVAIMPIHVFGNPCDVDQIEKIAKDNHLKVIYDAAHAVGSTYKKKSILNYGDISASSLHATKIFNTAEGGCCITNNEEVRDSLKRIRFFGHNTRKDDIIEDGFNGKMTEVHAALGLANLKYYHDVLGDRKTKYLYYKKCLEKFSNIRMQKNSYGDTNYSYFPVIFENEDRLITVQKALNKEGVFPRRYFYPAVNTFSKILEYSPQEISENISKRILCLPLYYKIQLEEIDKVLNLIVKSL